MAKVSPPSPWKNRIVGHAELPASDFLANPRNLRIHPTVQQEYLVGSLEAIGWVKSVIVNKRSDPAWGTDQHVETVVDGHDRIRQALRQGDDTLVPVEFVELLPSEEDTILMILDEMVKYATIDREQLAALMPDVKPSHASLQAMCARMCEEQGITAPDFQPVRIDEQGRLDEQAKVLCPECGAVFVPR